MNRALLWLLAAFAGSVLAQGGSNNDPRKPEAKVPAPAYRSAFEDYRRYREPELAPWREVNEEVARVGGHTGVMKHAEKQNKEVRR